eukprot:scaffold133216_cov57-Phaeocystis_antarctica.AAC.10
MDVREHLPILPRVPGRGGRPRGAAGAAAPDRDLPRLPGLPVGAHVDHRHGQVLFGGDRRRA